MSQTTEPETAATPAAKPAAAGTRALNDETKRIKDCALALCADADPASPGKAIDRLYLYRVRHHGGVPAI